MSIAQRFLLTALALGMLLVGACAERGPARPVNGKEASANTLESTLRRLSDRVRPVGALHLADVPQPYESKSELLAVLEELEQRKAGLLERYTEHHPDVVDVDRQMAIVRQQIEMLP